MSLEPLGTLSHAVTIRQRCVFFPITSGGSTMPPLRILFWNRLVMFLFGHRPHQSLAKPPAPRRLWLEGMAEGSLPPSLTAASSVGSSVCPQALQVPAEESGEARADSFCQARLPIPFLPSLSPLRPVAVWRFMPHVQLQQAEVGEEGKIKLILCSAVTLITQA